MNTNLSNTSRKAVCGAVPATLCAALLFTCAGSAHAQTQQAKATPAKATPISQVGIPFVAKSSRTEIILGGEVIMRVVGEAGLSAEQRADIIRERLIPILAIDDLQASDITLRSGPDMSYTSIYVRGNLLVTVTQALARSNNTTPEALANIYAERFRRVLPQVSGGEYSAFTDVADRGRF